MLRSGVLIGLVLGASCVAACDSGEDPTPVSTFRQEDPFARQITGRVFQGTETIEGALVRIDASATSTFGSDALLAATSELPRTASTDSSGSYRVPFAPFVYDLFVRRERELLVMRGVAGRMIEPQLGADAPVRGYKARVVPTTDPPPAPGNAVTYVVGGVDARTLSGAPGSLEVMFRRFDSTVTIFALEYVVANGLTNIVRSGRANIRVRDGEASAPVVAMTDVTTKKKVTFGAELPPGFTMASLEIELDAGLRTSAAPVTKATLGAPVEISIVPDIAYSVRGRATAAGAVSYSGRFVFDPNVETIPLLFPKPVPTESPIDDALPPPATGQAVPPVLEPGAPLAARFATGVLEHVLSPVSGDGPVVRIATTDRATTIPDVTRIGLPQPLGRYTWTVEHFPTLVHIEKLSGIDARIVPPSWTSSPRVIDVR